MDTSSLSCGMFVFFFFKQKTAYEIGTGDWSSDVCSSDLSTSIGLPERGEFFLEISFTVTVFSQLLFISELISM